ncbi:uncharacterized protein LOC127251609 [Andrographis paniculata]|uniref:uncharacterized protein LOC127251609 n=1 Tax=Andrographis paniculata TaxID=175694 RepID=UPI0021E83E2B|nr:uncharacterized protein LOC127251609 [Andrographis paniculata]
MAEDFEAAVEDGLRLSKRVYFGKDRAVAPPKPAAAMERAVAAAVGGSYLPTAPMFYAVITDPAIVDNPDMPSYQPYVYGKCDPPALIPLQMLAVSLEADCCLDTAFVTVTATWRLHCVMSSRSCDCRVAVPIGDQGSLLGVEIDLPNKSYCTQLIAPKNENGTEKIGHIKDGFFLKDNIFILTIPQIHGGTNISAKLRWSQKLLYHDGEFTLSIPFDFPEYVTPPMKKLPKRERIQLNVNAGPGTEILCKTTSHPLKEKLRKAGKLGFLYESDVLSWSSSNFMFTYSVSSSHIFGGVLLNPPILDDEDRRDTFCCYLFPGKQQSEKVVFRKEVVFVVDISGSMTSKLLKDTQKAILSALAKLDPGDSFNVIAFNNEVFLFSTTMKPATEEAIKNVTQWINTNFIAGGGTNILLPLNRAVQMLSDTCNAIPLVFLIADGSVEDEKHICDVMKNQLSNQKNIHPRIYTLGIGTFCNHYFLRMLAIIGNGHHEAATDVDSITVRMERLFARASSIVLANIAFQNLNELDDLEVYPSQIPDVSSESPLIVSGRYSGTFPKTIRVSGILPDESNFTLGLDVEDNEEVQIGKIIAKHQIELLTARTWFSGEQKLKEKIEKLSTQYGIVSEHTIMALVETPVAKTSAQSSGAQKVSSKSSPPKKTQDSKPQSKTTLLLKMGVGFGDITATAENIAPGSSTIKPSDPGEVFVKAASNCCGNLCNRCCCMCCVQACSRVNDQCAIVLTQLCGALACLGCYMCCGGQDG